MEVTMVKIKSFDLGGHKIKVKYLKAIIFNGREMFGLANPKTNEIQIALTMGGQKIDESVIEHTICHELTHMILMLMYEFDLNDNEKFVDNFGLFLHQFLKTKK